MKLRDRRVLLRWNVVFTAAIVVAALVPASRAGSPGANDDDLFYEVEGGRIVFTNVPSDASLPIPGMEPAVVGGPVGRGKPSTPGALPATIYDPFIERVAREHGLSPALIKAVALVESGFNPHAVSPKGAQGLMQLMPGTARAYGVNDALDPMQNLEAGAAHLRGLLDEFDGDLTLALAAYNAGSGAVRRHGGVPNYAETKEYVKRVHARLGRDAVVSPGAMPADKPREQPPVRLVMQANGSVMLSN